MTRIQKLFKQFSYLSTNPYKNFIIVKLDNLSVRNYTEGKIKCWKCGKDKVSREIFCTQCNIIQKPPSTTNYFEILQLKENYDINTKDLTQNFRNLQNQLHPDKYSNKSEEEKNVSQEYSSVVNQAYRNLLSPLQRGIHLLSLKGVHITESENTSNDTEFLSEIMEINEEVEEADTPEKLKELERKNKDILENIIKDLTKYFNNEDIDNAKKSIIRMKYYNSIAKQINNLLRERGIVD